MSICKDYFQCLSVLKLKKKNKEQYLKIKLVNRKGIFASYLWDFIDFYEERIQVGSIYAVKFISESYNDQKVIKIKNIKLIENESFKKYGYSDDTVLVSKNDASKYYYKEIVGFLEKYNSKSIREITDWVKRNKKIFMDTGHIEEKVLCLESLSALFEKFNDKINFELSIIIILLHKINLKKNNSILNFNKKYLNDVELYKNDNKGFIKKYKYIVDLVDYNFSNYKIINTKRDIK